MPMTPAMTTGMTFFITDPGWRMPVLSRLTPDFHVPHFFQSREGGGNDVYYE
jgi:hypothetical protein